MLGLVLVGLNVPSVAQLPRILQSARRYSLSQIPWKLSIWYMLSICFISRKSSETFLVGQNSSCNSKWGLAVLQLQRGHRRSSACLKLITRCHQACSGLLEVPVS